MDLSLLAVLFLLTWLLLVGLGIGAFWWQLDRRNRVVAARPSCAPLSWMVRPGRPAALHRRLRVAASPTRARTSGRRRDPQEAPPGSVEAMRRELEEQAAAIDDHLVMVSRLPRPARRAELARLATWVRHLEALGRRIRSLELRVPDAGAWVTPYDPSPLDRLDQLVGHHEQAVAELDALERASGLGEPVTLAALNRARVARPPTAAAGGPPSRRRS